MVEMTFPLFGRKCGLRFVRPSDFPAFYTWYCDPRVQKPLANPTWNPNVSPDEYHRHRFKRYLLNEPGNLVLAVVDIEESPIGLVNFFDFSPDDRCCEIGVLIGEVRLWRLGFGDEALRLALEYLKIAYDLSFVLAHISEDNAPSIKLFEKIGFRFMRETTLGGLPFRQYRYDLAGKDHGG